MRKRKKIDFRKTSLLGFFTGFGAWLIIFSFLSIRYALGQGPIDYLEVSLAQPLGIIMKGFWFLLGVRSLEVTTFLQVLMFTLAALMWGVIGAIIGFIVGKIYRTLEA